MPGEARTWNTNNFHFTRPAGQFRFGRYLESNVDADVGRLCNAVLEDFLRNDGRFAVGIQGDRVAGYEQQPVQVLEQRAQRVLV